MALTKEAIIFCRIGGIGSTNVVSLSRFLWRSTSSEEKLPDVIIPDVFTPANYNNPDLVDKLTTSANTVIGKENIVYSEPQMVGEDFARYGSTKDKVPTVLYWLGTVGEERFKSGDMPGLHSPYYYPDAKASIETGVKVTTQGLLDLFNSK